MRDFYIRFGRRFAIPSTVQIKHEIMRIVLPDPVQPAMTPANKIPVQPSL
jgi:hypothetical protein